MAAAAVTIVTNPVGSTQCVGAESDWVLPEMTHLVNPTLFHGLSQPSGRIWVF